MVALQQYYHLNTAAIDYSLQRHIRIILKSLHSLLAFVCGMHYALVCDVGPTRSHPNSVHTHESVNKYLHQCCTKFVDHRIRPL
jgi:hypothetical protein